MMTDDVEYASEELLADEEADRLIAEALYADAEPEPLVKLLLIIHDRVQEARLKDSISLLMKVAYRYSIVHSVNFQDYLEAIRQDRDPAEEARSRGYGGDDSET